jgi:hypothetical protein
MKSKTLLSFLMIFFLVSCRGNLRESINVTVHTHEPYETPEVSADYDVVDLRGIRRGIINTDCDYYNQDMSYGSKNDR